MFVHAQFSIFSQRQSKCIASVIPSLYHFCIILVYFWYFSEYFWGPYGSWINNYLCKQFLSPQKLWVRTLFLARCTRYNIMWYSLSVTCDRAVVFPGYSGFLHQEILLKVVLNTINQANQSIFIFTQLSIFFHILTLLLSWIIMMTLLVFGA